MKACPSGEQTRQCNEWGDWGAIDYSNCRCKAVDGFEATRVDSYATADCLDINGMPDGEFKQTRYCDAEGNWGEVDQSQCPVKWCPTVDSWYKVPVGHTPTIVRLGCMSGERWRQCNINGSWGPVNTDNCDCVYKKDDLYSELLRPGDSYSLPCSVGERVYKCNEESGYFDPVNLDSCKCGGEGRFPTTHAGELASAACDMGTSTRFCTLDGFWQSVDNSHCFCGEQGVWRKSEVGASVSLLCDFGFRVRNCNSEGFWEAAEESTCKCSGDFEAELGKTIMEECEEGAILHKCETGHFSEPDRSTCFCASRNEFGMIWDRLPAGGESPEVTCMNGERVTRKCGLTTGHWEDLDAATCRCTDEDGWTAAGVGEYSYGTCSGHSQGVSRRMCYGTHWGPVDESECIQECRYDGGDGQIQYVPVGDVLNVTCYVNLDGARSYRCDYNEETKQSELTLISDTCTRLSCESDLPPIYVDVGNSETRPCIDGFTGTRTRTCLPGGVWSDYDLTQCMPIMCKPIRKDDLLFSYTLAGVMGEVACAEGYSGAMKLFCNLKGEWEGEVINDCHQNFCPAEGEWPSIPALTSHTITCPAEYTGTWTRACLADGTWEEAVVPDTCIPHPPAMKTIPYEGMTHVSRAPSASLFTSVAIKELNPDCPVSIVSVENPEETYTLAVNATKTLMQGRHGNGGVFADFVLPADADVHDVSNYLRYGEYKAVFQPCWKALNRATVPDATLEVKFHTTAIPPSAPTHIAIRYLSDSFRVVFDAPQYVDEPYPVTAYYLAFQPPVLPEMRVDANARAFGDFKYIPGHVTLLLRAENAYGLSSPDVEVPYDFDEILMDGAHLHIEASAPALTMKRQVKTESGVEVTVGVTVPEDMADFASYLDVTCNGEAVPKFASLYATEYTFTTTAEEVTVVCYLTFGSTEGASASQTFSVVSTDKKYGAVTVRAEEVSAQRVKLAWTEPAYYTAEPIRAYAVECKRSSEVLFGKTQYTTSEELVVDAKSFVPGPMTCRVAAVSSLEEASASLNWGEVTVEAIREVAVEALTVESAVKGTQMVFTVNGACIDLTARAEAQSSVVVAEGVCEEDKTVVVLSGLRMATTYAVQVTSQAGEIAEAYELTTEGAQENEVAVASESVFASSAAVRVTMSTPDEVYCLAHTTPVHKEILLEQMKTGMLNVLFTPAQPATEALVVLTDLKASTEYSVTCLTRYSLTMFTQAAAFTTVAEEKPLTVLAVLPAGDSRKFAFDLVFDSRVELEEGASVLVSCGGRSEKVAMTASLRYPYRLHAELMGEEGFKAGSLCTLRFASLHTVYRAGTKTMLSATPFPEAAAFYRFQITTDGMAPILRSIVNVEMVGSVAVIATSTEELVIPETFAYTLQCVRQDRVTVNRAYTEKNGFILQTTAPAAKKGVAELGFRVDNLPNNHDCKVRFAKSLLQDLKGNEVSCPESEGECALPFTSRLAAGGREERE